MRGLPRAVLVVVGALLPGGCAGLAPSSLSSSSTTATALVAPVDFDDGPPTALVPAHVARPATPAEAGVLVGEAMRLLQRGQPAAALPRLQALLGSDFLSDRGRANLYWLLADAAGGVDDAVHRDALGGYLVAASILAPDAEVRDRMGRARAGLLADKVHAFALGTTPERAIDVDNLGEADVVVAALQCGRRGSGRYVARRATADDGNGGLAVRRLLCTETGDELVLFFRVGP
jgi:hypothetical protein